MSSLRILPLLILVSAVVLSVRVADVVNLWRGTGTTDQKAVSMVQMAQAQEPAPANGANAGARTTPSAQPGLDTPGADNGAASSPAADQEAASKASNDTTPNFGGDPTMFTQEEIDLLQNLSARRAELDKRAQQLDERESILAAAEKRIDTKVGEMKKLQAAIEQLVKKKDKEEQDRYKKLITVYEKMKPKDAARIWNDLDMSILLEVAQGMREASTAAILAQMSPDRARALTTELAHKQDLNDLPTPPTLN